MSWSASVPSEYPIGLAFETSEGLVGFPSCSDLNLQQQLVDKVGTMRNIDRSRGTFGAFKEGSPEILVAISLGPQVRLRTLPRFHASLVESEDPRYCRFLECRAVEDLRKEN